MSYVASQVLRRWQATDLEQQGEAPVLALRLIVCGDKFAGKTTLSSSLAKACSKRKLAHQKGKAISKHLHIIRPEDRTRGIEIHKIKDNGIHISLWDMAGQREFQALYECMLMSQGSSSEDSRPVVVLFVWSPVASENEAGGVGKLPNAFYKSFWYWLTFVAPSTSRSSVARKVIVALTRFDQKPHVEDLVKKEINDLREKFHGIVEISAVLQVDARRSASVKPLANSIFKAAEEVLRNVKTYNVCNRVSRHVSSSIKRKIFFEGQPIIEWGKFEKYLEETFRISNRDVQKGIASSLHDSGELIHLGNMLILDIHWFCRETSGKLIHFSEWLPPNVLESFQLGCAPIEYVEKTLEDQFKKKVSGSQLLTLMEAMHLSSKDPKDPHGSVFITSTLFTPSSRRSGLPLTKWKEGINGSFAYLGRRLECDRKNLTSFSLGLFVNLQALFLDKIKTGNIELDYDGMSICVSEMEIILECGQNVKGDHVVIDVMVRFPLEVPLEERKNLIKYVENGIITSISQVCREPVGNEGIKLVEGVIHPDALVDPVSLREREDRCVPILDLKQQLRKQLEETTRQERLVYEWKGNKSQPFVDLMGVDVVEEFMRHYKESLISANEEVRQATGVVFKQNDEDVSTSVSPFSAAAGSTKVTYTSPANHGMQHDDSKKGIMVAEVGESSTKVCEEDDRLQCWFSHNPSDHEDNKESLFDENGQPITAGACLTRSLSSLYTMFQEIKTKLDEIKDSVDSGKEDMQKKLDAMHAAMLGELDQIRNSVLPKVVKTVEQILYFSVGQEEGKLPRLISLTTGGKAQGIRQRMTASMLKGQTEVVHIELFCEHRGRPHRVEEQEGLSVTIIKDDKLLKKAFPWINGLLKLLALVAKVGAHVLAGASSVIDIPDLAALIAYGLDTPGVLYDNKGFQRQYCSPKEALVGWQEWLSSVLRTHGGLNDDNIDRRFKLRRVKYLDTSQVAWLCPKHCDTNMIEHYRLP